MEQSKSGVSGHSCIRCELEHLRTLQQGKGLIAQTAFPPRAVGPGVHTAVPDTAIAIEQGTPIACLRSCGQIPLTEGLDAIRGNSMRGISICDERLDLLSEIAKVTLDFNVILVGPTGHKEVVMMLDVLEFMGDNDGFASLAIFEGRRVRPA